MVRIEAGFIMPGDDFNTAETTVRADHDRSPFEVGLDWVVNFDKCHFTGKRALLKEQDRPIKRRLLKLVVEGNKAPADSFLYDGKKGRRIGTIKDAGMVADPQGQSRHGRYRIQKWDCAGGNLGRDLLPEGARMAGDLG